jgi:hypothetical protein
MSDNDDPKPYLCEQCGAVLGMIIKGSDRRAKLSVFRLTLPAVAGQLESLPGDYPFGVTELEQGNPVCGICGAVRKWRMSQRALDELLERSEKRSYGLVEVKP